MNLICHSEINFHLISAMCPVSQQPTLRLLQRRLYKVADKWEDIGIQLDVDIDLLEKVKSKSDGDSKKCLREMLKVLMKTKGLQPSWSELVDALECLEEEELAQQLRDEYC